MNSSRPFTLLLWLGIGGVFLLVAGSISLLFGLERDGHGLGSAVDRICIIAPVDAGVLSRTLSYGASAVLFGAIGMVLWYAVHQAWGGLTLRRRIKGALPADRDPHLGPVTAKLGMEGTVLLVPSRGRLAFTAGLWRPAVYVTTGLVDALTGPQLEAVLLHEERHLRHRDPLRTAIVSAMAALVFFLPVLRDLASRYLVGKEIDADAWAVRRQGTRSHLASALYALAGTHQLSVAPAVGFADGSSVAARIDALSSGHWRGTPLSRSSIRWSIAGLVLLTALAVQPWAGASAWSLGLVSWVACPAWLLLFWLRKG